MQSHQETKLLYGWESSSGDILDPILAVLKARAELGQSMTTEVFCNEDRKQIKKQIMLCPASPNLKAAEGPVPSAVQDKVRTNGMMLAHYNV